jgi:hypothetical protein
MSNRTLAAELPHPHSAGRWQWVCEWCDADGEEEASDLIPDVCPECASGRLWSADLWAPCIDDDDFAFTENLS